MGELLLCNNKMADTPYYLENFSVNIYSLEELCYCMEQNPYLIEESLFQDAFLEWLGKELKQTELSDRLRLCLQKKSFLTEAVSILLEETAYCHGETAEHILETLTEMQAKSPFESRKIKADRCMEQKKYRRAASEYRKLLSMEEECSQNPHLSGIIRHNLGVAYARLFLFQEAEDCFFKAYEENLNHTSLCCALACCFFREGRAGFEASAAAYRITDDEKKELACRLLETGGGQTAERFEELIEEWMRQSGGGFAENGELKGRLCEWKAEYLKNCEV